jgi:hypothetical protein
MRIPHYISTLTKVYTSVKEKLKAIYNSFFCPRIRTFAVGKQGRRGLSSRCCQNTDTKNVSPF